MVSSQRSEVKLVEMSTLTKPPFGFSLSACDVRYNKFDLHHNS